ncbi:hypothetical protein E4T50_09309 [Aureobasidium sp. EXF-12298]|nr:hypothetical protein E4T50_09309 [Aureobasidium sp. EXF-12298]KAI4762926.1 hypothetical protein E4T51_04060 [Aureobasidium sp. EXF-12344]KAI4776526.1 hypothetical protein E4T52_08511 [Aureobasidium sp. EXF-3400]
MSSDMNNISNTMDVKNTNEIETAPISISYKMCQACQDDFEAQTLIAMPCGHYWCQDCVSRVCSNVRNETDLPIRCDKKCNIPEEVALNVLPQEEAKLFETKLQELKTPSRERHYCANKDCGHFIPPVAQQQETVAVCQKCEHTTCKLCRALQHDGDCAGPSKEDEQAFALIKKEGYQTCSECDRVVERTQGCPHMTCYCGHEFCYHCGGPISTCNGCGWLEPDTRTFEHIAEAQMAAEISDPARLQEVTERIQTELFYLRPRRAPVSPHGMTQWFAQNLLQSGYRGQAVFFHVDWTMQVVNSREAMPSQEELEVSDAMIFSLFDTGYMVLNDDGTSEIVVLETGEESEDGYEQDGEEDEEGDWDM